MSTEVHDCDVWLDSDVGDGSAWVAACSCGWQGALFDPDQHGHAVEAWENHCDVVFMEATGG